VKGGDDTKIAILLFTMMLAFSGIAAACNAHPDKAQTSQKTGGTNEKKTMPYQFYPVVVGRFCFYWPCIAGK
jgi:hypothetical protein